MGSGALVWEAQRGVEIPHSSGGTFAESSPSRTSATAVEWSSPFQVPDLPIGPDVTSSPSPWLSDFCSASLQLILHVACSFWSWEEVSVTATYSAMILDPPPPLGFLIHSPLASSVLESLMASPLWLGWGAVIIFSLLL